MKTNIAHTEQQEFPEETLWKFMERGIYSDSNRHDALVYFGRRISRQTFVEQVHLWARVIRGMGLKEGDELLLFGPSLPEFIYIMLAADMTGVTANLPNLMVSPEALDMMVGKSRVAFVFDGMEQMIRHTLQREQFEYVVVVSATRTMGYPLKLVASPLNGIKYFSSRHRAKYLTADAAGCAKSFAIGNDRNGFDILLAIAAGISRKDSTSFTAVGRSIRSVFDIGTIKGLAILA